MPAHVVLYVQDLDRMCAFYARCLGLEPVATPDEHRILASDVWRLHLVRMAPGARAAAAVSSRREGTPIKLAFPVARIDDARSVAPAAGGAIDPASAEWDWGGFRRCDGVDPEGNVVQLLEPLPSPAAS